MKYVVVSIINSNVDSNHPSGVAMCSTGDGEPWIFAKSGLFENKVEAFRFEDKLYDKLLGEFKEEQSLNDGWKISLTHRSIRIDHIGEDGEIDDSVWVLSTRVICIGEE